MTALLHWIAANPGACVEAIVGFVTLCSVVAGATTRDAQRRRVLGRVVRFARRWGAAKHRDEPGTLSWPGVIEAAVDAAAETDREASIPPAPSDHAGDDRPTPDVRHSQR